MNIAVFHNLPFGGANRVASQQIKFLAQKHQVKLFQPHFSLTGNRLSKDRQNFFGLNQLHQNTAQTINHQYDLCLVHPDRLTQAPFLLKYLKIPSIYYCHELLRIAYEPELAPPQNLPLHKKAYEIITRQIRRQIDKTNAQSADLILTNSKYTQANVRKAYQKNSVVCYPGVKANVFKPRPAKRDQVLFIGEKHQINGWDLIRHLRIKNLKVIDQQNLTDKQLSHQYSKSFCVLCLGFNEPFGLVPLEAAACQTPVIALNQAGYQETIINNKTGFLVKPDAEKITEKIVYLINHPEQVKKIGQTARRHVIKNFSWAQHFDILEKNLS